MVKGFVEVVFGLQWSEKNESDVQIFCCSIQQLMFSKI